MKTDAGVDRQEGTPCRMFARSLWESAMRSRSRSTSLARMTPLVNKEDTARDLAHAARTAIQGQALSPTSEPLAIDEEHLAHYFETQPFPGEL